MVRQHHRLNGHEFEQTPEDSGEERRLVCPWGPKESDTTKQPNNNSNKLKILLYSLFYSHFLALSHQKSLHFSPTSSPVSMPW